MKDKEPQSDLEVRFGALQGELIAQINTTYQESLQEYKGVVVRVVTNEWDSGSQALLLGSDGKWSGKMDMMGWDIGEPSLDDLLEDYAEIKDPEFDALKHEEYEAEETYTKSASPEVNRIMDIRIRSRGKEEVHLSPGEQSLLDAYHEGREALEEEWRTKRQAYVTENKGRLLQGFVAEMERVLGELRNPEQSQKN